MIVKTVIYKYTVTDDLERREEQLVPSRIVAAFF